MGVEWWKERRGQRLESLAADSIRCLPQHDQGSAKGFIVNPKPLAVNDDHVVVDLVVQDTERRLSVISRYCRELPQDLSLNWRGARQISAAYRCNQLPTCRSTESFRHHCLLHCYSVTITVRQRLPFGNKSAEAMRRKK